MKNKKKKYSAFAAMDAAVDFIRPYLLKGDMYSLRPQRGLEITTEKFTAHIEGHSVVVTKLLGEEVNEKFHLEDLMRDLIYELAEKLKKGKIKK